MKELTKEMIKKIEKVLEDNYYERETEGSEYYTYEIFVDYRYEYFEDNTLAKISKADYPREELDEIESEWIFDSSDYYEDELFSKLESEFEEEWEEWEDEIREYVHEHVSYTLPNGVEDQEVKVVIATDVGDMNYDFTECNILNWYGTYGGYDKGKKLIPTNSPIGWLAKQQGKYRELEHIVRLLKDPYVEKLNTDKVSKFTKSVVQELENATSHMNTLIFLVKMPLFEFIQLREIMRAEEEANKSYHYEERKGKSYITISKKSDCGLYDIWNGGGSVLEIELEKDVKLPVKAIFDVWIDCRGCKANGRGYDVDEVYGLSGEAWHGEVKEIKEVA